VTDRRTDNAEVRARRAAPASVLVSVLASVHASVLVSVLVSVLAGHNTPLNSVGWSQSVVRTVRGRPTVTACRLPHGVS
jgi:hypothetical protein